MRDLYSGTNRIQKDLTDSPEELSDVEIKLGLWAAGEEQTFLWKVSQQVCLVWASV